MSSIILKLFKSAQEVVSDFENQSTPFDPRTYPSLRPSEPIKVNPYDHAEKIIAKQIDDIMHKVGAVNILSYSDKISNSLYEYLSPVIQVDIKNKVKLCIYQMCKAYFLDHGEFNIKYLPKILRSTINSERLFKSIKLVILNSVVSNSKLQWSEIENRFGGEMEALAQEVKNYYIKSLS